MCGWLGTYGDLLHSLLWIVSKSNTRSRNHVAVKAYAELEANKMLDGTNAELNTQLYLWERPNEHIATSTEVFRHYDTEEGDNRLIIIMPLYGGDVGRFPRLTLGMIKRIVLHTLRGLTHLHEHGIAHTDVKGSNIFYEIGLPLDSLDEYLSRRLGPDHQLMNVWAMNHGEGMQATYLIGDYCSGKHSRIMPMLSV